MCQTPWLDGEDKDTYNSFPQDAHYLWRGDIHKNIPNKFDKMLEVLWQSLMGHWGSQEEVVCSLPCPPSILHIHSWWMDEWINQQRAWRRFWWGENRKGKKATFFPRMLWDKPTSKLKEIGTALLISENNSLKLEVDTPWSEYCLTFWFSS